MRKNISVLLVLTALAVAGPCGAAAQGVFATGLSDANWLPVSWDRTLGTPFTLTGGSVTVGALGFFQQPGLSDGLSGTHVVGIFGPDLTLLGSATVPSGTAAPYHDGTRWATLATPITLTPGNQYVLAATVTTDGDYVNAAPPPGVTIAPGFSLAGSDFLFASGTELQYPDIESGQWFYAFGANLEAVPEPGVLTLLGAGLGAVALHLRRRRPAARPHTLARGLAGLGLAALTSALPAQTIDITTPTNNAVVPVGTTCTIGWTSTLPPGTPLEISIGVPNANSQPVAGCLPVEAGQYQWLVPWACNVGSNCQVRIAIQGSATYTGTNYFTLAPNPQPTLLLHAPAGGEQWPVGATRSVSWEPHNLTGTLTLNLLQGTNVADTLSGIPVASNRVAYALPAGLAAGHDYTVRLTSDAAPSATAASPPFTVTWQTPTPRKWTMLFYFDAAAFMLEANTLQSFLDLGTITAATNINYVCQYARSPNYIANYLTNYPWWGVNRFVIQPGITPAAANAVQNLGNRAMCAPDTLTDFINWAVENYPAQNYFLILSDHGDGWAGGLLLDEVNGRHEMSTRQLQQALQAAEAPMTVLGLDMCVEADTEVAYQLRNSGPQILIASQFQESRNWPYHTVFQQLQDKLPDDSLTLEGLAILFCQAFVDAHSDPMDSGTLSAFRLNQVDALTAAVASFADTLTTNYQNTAAVRQQADAVSTALNQAIIYCARTKLLQQKVFGLNIYFPLNPPPNPAYGTLDVIDFGVDSHWAAFLNAYYQNLTNTWIGDARTAGSQDATTIDLSWFCQIINPATNAVRLTMMSDGPGNTTPGGTSLIFTNGQTIGIEAIPQAPNPHLTPVRTNHFVRWLGDDQAIVANPAAAQTTVQLTGDSLLTAQFAEDKTEYTVCFVTEGNGSLAQSNSISSGGAATLTQLVAAGSHSAPVMARPKPGYVFAGWGGDYPATANPLVITNVQMDTTVIAFFWPVPPLLSIRQTGASVNLTWPVSASDFVLESSSRLPGGSWNAVPGVNTNSISLPLSTTNRFFRLRREPLLQ